MTGLLLSPQFQQQQINSEESVHLQLNKQLEGQLEPSVSPPTAICSEIQEELEESSKPNTTITLVEYVDKNTNETILGGAEGIGPYEISLYSIHLHEKNISQRSDVFLRVRDLDLKDTSNFNMISRLWESSRLLAHSRDFPSGILLTDERGSFEDKFSSNVRKMKIVHSDANLTDDTLDNFLQTQNLTQQFAYKTGRDRNETLAILKSFAVWFRQNFPYYYNECQLCDERVNGRYYGKIFPLQSERTFRAGVTELYSCSKCNQTSRFARFNLMTKVLETRRGRCGEYSVLILRMLMRLGYETRWVVDWEDHVWVEVKVDEDWVHIDPCEAAVGENLIYQGWGKKQTFIFAYGYTPPYVEDVTSSYTSNFTASIRRRLEANVTEDLIQTVMSKARQELKLLTVAL